MADGVGTSRRELNKARCRRAILKASRRLFSERGFEATSMDEVARKAEVSRGTLYNYFPNKESLLVGIAEEELDKVNEALRGELRDETRADERLYRALELFVLDSFMYPDLSRKITYLNSIEGGDLYATRIHMVSMLEDLVDEAIAQGAFVPDAEPAELVDAVMGVYLAAQFHWKDVPSHSEEACRARLRRAFDRAVEAFRSVPS